MRSRTWLSASILSVLMCLVGCTAFQAAETAGEPQVAGSGDVAVPRATEAPTEPGAERQIARTGSLSLRCDDITVAAEQLRRLAGSLGGYVASESVNGRSSSQMSRIVFSVPAASMEKFITEAVTFGELLNRSTTAKDVTEQVADVDARIRTLRESIGRIRVLMGRAGSISDIARVEEELTRRQSDLESMLAQQTFLRNQVERAPVTVTLVRPGQVEQDNPFLTGLTRGWRALQESIALLLTMFGGVLPFALVAALIVWPLISRHRRQTTAARATSAAGSDDGAEAPEQRGEPEAGD